MSTHKSYGIQFANEHRNGRFVKRVTNFNGEVDGELLVFLSNLIDFGMYEALDDVIVGISGHLSTRNPYIDFLDFINVDCIGGVVMIRYDDDSDHATIPAEDLLAILTELKEFVLQPPLHGQV